MARSHLVPDRTKTYIIHPASQSKFRDQAKMEQNFERLNLNPVRKRTYVIQPASRPVHYQDSGDRPLKNTRTERKKFLNPPSMYPPGYVDSFVSQKLSDDCTEFAHKIQIRKSRNQRNREQQVRRLDEHVEKIHSRISLETDQSERIGHVSRDSRRGSRSFSTKPISGAPETISGYSYQSGHSNAPGKSIPCSTKIHMEVI